MHVPQSGKKQARSRRNRISEEIGLVLVLLLSFAFSDVVATDPVKSPVVKIAVFDFELEDVSPAASLLDKTTSSAAAMDKVSSAARRELAQSGRYTVIDASVVDAKPVKAKSLRNCDGCEAAIALQLGADQSLIGIVSKVTQTDYYVLIKIRDARTGELLDQQEANFAGSEEGWATGVRMLIKHQILASQN